MAANYILIDFENIQPDNLEILISRPFQVFVFVGKNQTKMSFEFVSAMQKLGNSAQYIKMTALGKNALDFHIAYYLGKISTKEPDATFYIISNDTGFDPLIQHLRTNNIKVQRKNNIEKIPSLAKTKSQAHDDQMQSIIINLKSRGDSKPRKTETLLNTINTLFIKKLSEQQLKQLVKKLEDKQYIQIQNNRISYHLP